MHRRENLSSDLRTVIQGSCTILTEGLNVCNAPEATIGVTDAKNRESMTKDCKKIDFINNIDFLCGARLFCIIFFNSYIINCKLSSSERTIVENTLSLFSLMVRGDSIPMGIKSRSRVKVSVSARARGAQTKSFKSLKRDRGGEVQQRILLESFRCL